MKTEIKTVWKIVLKTDHKIIYSYYKKKMSFIKVKDPRKREELIKDFIETRKRIKDNFIAKKVGEIEYQTGLTKLFKPVTETQKATAKEITEKITQELLPIREGIERLPEAISFPAYPAVEMTKEELTNLGPIATKALMGLASKKGVDKVFGLKVEKKNFKIGDKKIKIKDDNIIIDGVEYKGTPGLWELIMSNDPQNFTEEDFQNYGELLMNTNAIPQEKNPNKPRSSSSPKWVKIVSPIWEEVKKRKRFKTIEEEADEDDDPQPSTSGTGLKILPSDPNALIDRFDLLFSSKKAGHTGVRNEIVSILDELKRQGVLKTNEYKKLNSLIKK